MHMKLCGVLVVLFAALTLGAVAMPPQCLANGDRCKTLNTWMQCCPGLLCERIGLDSPQFQCNSPQTSISSKNSSIPLKHNGK